MQDVIINREPVELYKVLKFEGLVSTGGEAKMVVAEGLVKVNGELEMRKRCKLKGGDVVEFNGESLRLVFGQHHD
ncbi:MAG: RNA-binding S4 domain-containing protein [Arenicella sp.]|nr:RNA-binding S4 domain-containing protein [Arenicella sp.]